jgi:hypothetical protein
VRNLKVISFFRGRRVLWAAVAIGVHSHSFLSAGTLTGSSTVAWNRMRLGSAGPSVMHKSLYVSIGLLGSIRVVFLLYTIFVRQTLYEKLDDFKFESVTTKVLRSGGLFKGCLSIFLRN